MKIVVNPTYEHLRKFIESVPDTFERDHLLRKESDKSDGSRRDRDKCETLWNSGFG